METGTKTDTVPEIVDEQVVTQDQGDDLQVEELLVEEISIDGMCGVY